jgi:EAL domain-containing protein (putative c-di-GMP-specific phosphodiesterase class I)/DNA-binding response OmpR family regulator
MRSSVGQPPPSQQASATSTSSTVAGVDAEDLDPSATLTEQAPILIVDDDEQIRQLLGAALGRAGLATVLAADGTEALRTAERQPIALVVLDVTMPGLSGYEVVAALRRRPATATVPILLVTGMNDRNALVRGLEAGADDFLPKPVRLAEFVARVRAHLRSHQAWTEVVASELSARSRLVAAFGRLSADLPPEDAAAHVAERLAQHTDCHVVEILRMSEQDLFLPLVAVRTRSGVRRGGPAIARQRGVYLRERMRHGPWLEARPAGTPTTEALGGCEIAAAAPIYAGEAPVGLLLTGLAQAGPNSSSARRASLLGATLDAASMLSALIGSALADRGRVAATRVLLRETLAQGAFHPVFQPIVEMSSGAVVAYEALTRFDDGTPPDARFAEAAANGLGPDYEIAAIEAAMRAAESLPHSTRLSVNVSPDLVKNARFREFVASSSRPLILELTEHAPIEDYAGQRHALDQLGSIEMAVDDAGAGYASMRHILELRPAYAKLDISIVRGIESDPLRQALVAGLVFFASHAGCQLIAEGIETRAEADLLIGLGITLGQGFYFARPGPL